MCVCDCAHACCVCVSGGVLHLVHATHARTYRTHAPQARSDGERGKNEVRAAESKCTGPVCVPELWWLGRCGHCKKLSPIWDEAADKVAEEGLDVHFAKMDCTARAHTSICERCSVCVCVLVCVSFGVGVYARLFREAGTTLSV